MCGICGIAQREGTVPEALLRQMNAALFHRGPDEDGYSLHGHVGLAMRRLSIIDLTTGKQPIGNEDGSIQVVFNGEIYNYPDLKLALERAGHRFATQTDTEVIPHGYEQHGLDYITQLNGMFTFALYDDNEDRLVLGRDRTGQKPLFYYHSGDTLYFASELKSLLLCPEVPREIDDVALYHYLTLQYVPGPGTILKGVKQLPPAHFAVWQRGELSLHRYREPRYSDKQQMTDDEWIAATRETMQAAVHRHMLADVPLGAYLSGGVDSSIVTALMAERGTVKTFSIGFDVAQYSETEHARRVAEHYATDHREFIVSANAVLEHLPEVVWIAGQPLADTSCVVTYHLAMQTRKHVTVALTGDGGDEAFAGYTRYLLDRLLRLYRILPEAARTQLVPALAGLLPDRADIPTDRNVVEGLKRLAQASTTTHKASIVAWGSFFTEAQKRNLGTGDWLRRVGNAETTAWMATVYDAIDAGNRLERTQGTDLLTYLPDDLLVKADRMAMAHSLETRAPFLDNEVLALAAAMPENLKIRGRTQKWVLREAFKQELPPENVNRIKRGFGMPVATWLREPLREMAYDLLLSDRAVGRGYFRREAVRALLDAHTAKQADHGQRLWALLTLEMWLRQVVDGERLPVAERNAT
ncbi:MAG: asparagine synthase (glutamine-hydrolyzing) [Chloroflexota bacterium]